jgi:hypothetical protein
MFADVLGCPLTREPPWAAPAPEGGFLPGAPTMLCRPIFPMFRGSSPAAGCRSTSYWCRSAARMMPDDTMPGLASSTCKPQPSAQRETPAGEPGFWGSTIEQGEMRSTVSSWKHHVDPLRPPPDVDVQKLPHRLFHRRTRQQPGLRFEKHGRGLLRSVARRRDVWGRTAHSGPRPRYRSTVCVVFSQSVQAARPSLLRPPDLAPRDRPRGGGP